MSGFTTDDVKLTRVNDWLAVGKWDRWHVWDVTDAPNIHQIGTGFDTKQDAIIYAHMRIDAEHGPTIDDLAKAAGIKSFDTALPADWLDKGRNLGPVDPVGHIVWSYDYDPMFGQPTPITPQGHLILALYDLADDQLIDDDTRAMLQTRIGLALKGMR